MNIENLMNFIKEHENWHDLLKKPPYSLKSIVHCAYNPKWYMFNYNLFDSDLTNPIVCVCRGSVLEIKENNGVRDVKIICNPYYKFFNYGDPNAAEIDWTSSSVQSKEDGQLIKMSRIDGKSYWFTNGSFDLGVPIDKEDKEKGIKNYRQLLAYALKQEDSTFSFDGLDNKDDNTIRFEAESNWTRSIPDGWTFMFELCSPLNKIQVQYNSIKLWFHGARDPNGLEHQPEVVSKIFGIPYEIPKRWNLHNLQDTLNMLSTFKEDKEGFVIVDGQYNRIKMKSETYLKLKFANEDRTPQKLFFLVITDGYDDLLPIIPDIRTDIDEFITRLKTIQSAISKIWQEARAKFEETEKNKKEFAMLVEKQVESWKKPLWYSSVSIESPDEIYFKLISKWTILTPNHAYKRFTDLENLSLKELGISKE